MKKHWALLEAPISCGSPTRGSEGAYDALMEAGLAGLLGTVTCYPMEKLAPCVEYPSHLRHLDTVMAVSRALRENVLAALERGQFPFVVGGDHSVSMGTLAALGEFYGAGELAVVYIDGHTDINTDESSVTGYIHGMDLAAACGLCCGELTVGKQRVNLYGEDLHIIGARSIDPAEYPIVAAQGVDLCTADMVREQGMAAVIQTLLPALKGKKVHISFDVDCLDPAEFSATGYNLPRGLSLGEVGQLISAVLATGQVCSFECVEYNPALDPEGRDLKKLMELFASVLI